MAVVVEIDQHRARVELSEGASKLIRKIAFDIEGAAKRSMAGPKRGKLYPRGKARGKRRRFHRASAPREAPAIDTGTLVNSLRATFPTKLKAVIDVGANYGSFLEFGTRYMERRPFIQPAIEGVLDRLANL